MISLSARRPVAVATLLTLIVIPVVYDLVETGRERNQPAAVRPR